MLEILAVRLSFSWSSPAKPKQHPCLQTLPSFPKIPWTLPGEAVAHAWMVSGCPLRAVPKAHQRCPSTFQHIHPSVEGPETTFKLKPLMVHPRLFIQALTCLKFPTALWQRCCRTFLVLLLSHGAGTWILPASQILLKPVGFLLWIHPGFSTIAAASLASSHPSFLPFHP